MKIRWYITSKQFYFCMAGVLGIVIMLFSGAVTSETAEAGSWVIYATEEAYETEKPHYTVTDVSLDRLVENLPDTGFSFYEIPVEYKEAGGDLSEDIQLYIWEQCKDRGVDFYIALGVIERESDYKSDATGDYGNSKGYMQIFEKWHKERMAEEDVEDLYDPYGNVRVGLNFLAELYEKYGTWDKALMAYNMGESKAKAFWNEGIFETDYTKVVQRRAQEIKQELGQD